MNKNSITAVIPIRKGSTRIPNKNFKDFKNGLSLLELKLNILKSIGSIDEIVVNTDSDIAIEIAKKYNVSYFRREDYYASSSVSQSDFFVNLAENTNSDSLLYAPCTSPFIKLETYNNVINLFKTNYFDSVITVGVVKEFLWLDNKPINYDIKNAPNSQDLPNIHKLNFGVNIVKREVILEQKNIIGRTPFFYEISEHEGIDIDYQIDFEFAQFLDSNKKTN